MGNFLSDFVDGITGETQAKGAKRAAKLQYDSSMAALDFQKDALAQQIELNQPYVDLGVGQIDPFLDQVNAPGADQTLANDPYGYDYLSNNPLFQAAIDNNAAQLKGTAAARGKYNSGGLVNQLFQNYLATGDQFYGNYLARQDALQNSAVNRSMLPVSLGQSAAVGQSANIGNFAANAGNLTTQGGNALAAGQMGAANAQAAGANNLVDIGTTIAALAILCDQRAKDVICTEGFDTDGLPLYRFRYKTGGPEYIGKMAQDIMTLYPDDVIECDDGLLRVALRHAPKRVH